MTKSTWKTLSKLYKQEFGVPETVLSVMCTRAVLTLCVSGMSNKSIAEFLEVDRKIVDEYISIVFGFSGWEKDLGYSPLYRYKTTGIYEGTIDYDLCKKYIEIYSKIEPYYK